MTPTPENQRNDETLGTYGRRIVSYRRMNAAGESSLLFYTVTLCHKNGPVSIQPLLDASAISVGITRKRALFLLSADTSAQELSAPASLAPLCEGNDRQ
jgi:hypothetical protein